VQGGNGEDWVHGGSGDDTVAGGDASDRVGGGRGNDTVHGDNGSDRVFGGWGADTIYGDDGDDRLHALARDKQTDTLDCGSGNDTAIVRRSEKERTTLVGCETVHYVTRVAAADEAAENESGD
jgi:Ca2+-binding RTX toxin-like protein